MYSYNHKMGQKIQTDVNGVAVDRSFLAHFQVSASNATSASDTAIHTAITLGTSTTTVTTSITNPGVPRALRIKGNVAGITGNVIITGTNYVGEVITETIVANGSSAVEGNKAFKTVTQIVVPVKNADGNTISIGFNEKLGLPYKLAHNTVLSTYLDNVKEATSATVTTSAIAIEGNTIDLNSVLSSKVVDVYLIV